MVALAHQGKLQGSSAVLFCAVFALALLAKLFSQGKLNLFYLVAFVVIGCAGAYLTRYALQVVGKLSEAPEVRATIFKPGLSTSRLTIEGQIMQLAQVAKGRLSASEVAAATHLDIHESHQVLRGLVKQGVAEVWVTDEGGVVYVFPELFAGYKDGASDPFAR